MRIPLLAWIHEHDGIAHSHDLHAAGYSPHLIRRAVDARQLERVRRSWLLAPQCTSDRRAAAEAGGRVTCVTAARRLGLWNADAESIHLAVPPTASRISHPDRRLHWGTGPVPTGRYTVEDPLLNVLFHVAKCVAPTDAVTIWEAALRQDFVTLPQLRRTDWRSTAATDVLKRMAVQSDSVLETRFLAIMRSGGVAVRQQVLIDGHPVDALIGERLVVQVDGFEFHSNPRDRRRDLRQDARLTLLGYTVLRFDYQQVMFDQQYVQETILNAIAQGLHVATRR